MAAGGPGLGIDHRQAGLAGRIEVFELHRCGRQAAAGQRVIHAGVDLVQGGQSPITPMDTPSTAGNSPKPGSMTRMQAIRVSMSAGKGADAPRLVDRRYHTVNG